MNETEFESLFVAKQVCLAKITDLNGCYLRSKAISLAIRATNLTLKSSDLEFATGPIRELTTDAKFLKEAAGLHIGGVFKAASDLAFNITEEAATTVINSYENLLEKYKIISKNPQYQLVIEKIKENSPLNTQETKVKYVDEAFNELKNVYDSMLNLTKIVHYANKLSSKSHPGLNNFKFYVETLINSLKESRDDQDLIPESSQKLQKIYLKLQKSYLNLKTNQQKRVIDEISALFSAVNHTLSDLEYQTFEPKLSNFKPDLTFKQGNWISH